jgi:hypothetical protein
MSMVSRNAANPNLPQLETVDRLQIVHSVPPPPSPPMGGEDYRATQTLARFQRGGGGTPNADVTDLDGLFDEGFTSQDEEPVTENQSEVSTEGNVEETPAPRTLSFDERKREILRVRHELDAVKYEIRNSNLDKATKDGLMDQAIEIYRQIAQGRLPDPDQLRQQVSALKVEVESSLHEGDSAPAATTTSPDATTPASADDKAEFLREIRQAKREFRQTVESHTDLSQSDRESIIQTFNQKADALGNRNDIDQARVELEQLSTEMQDQIETTSDATQDQIRSDRQSLYNDMLRVTDEPKFKENDGHWRQVGWRAGELFKTALQGNNWTDFRSFIAGLKDGDQRFVPIMRLVSAIYRTAGRDEAKAFKMINTLVPKEVIQDMINKVTEDSANLDWHGQGWPDNQDQVGPDKWHEWTPRGTADFLHRSLEARREFDPYTASQESSTPAS